MTIQKKQLTARQEKTVAAVISAKTVEEGLRQAGVSKGAYYGWVKTPHFSQALQTARRELVENAHRILERSLSEAALTLQRLLSSTDERVQRLAAIGILEQHNQRMKTEELERRLDALEGRLSQK